MAFIRELNRKVSSDLDEKVNKKQIFYTTITLLLEAASKYIQLLDPSIFRGKQIEYFCFRKLTATRNSQPFMHTIAVYLFLYVCIVDSERNEENSLIFLDDHTAHDVSSNLLHNAKLGSEINTYFQIAKESWIILHSSDTFDKGID